jgi:hypothetical protein
VRRRRWYALRLCLSSPLLPLSPLLNATSASRNLQSAPRPLQFRVPHRPHRLEAQDTALSRRRQGFESPWGYYFCGSCGCDNPTGLDCAVQRPIGRLSHAAEQFRDRFQTRDCGGDSDSICLVAANVFAIRSPGGCYLCCRRDAGHFACWLLGPSCSEIRLAIRPARSARRCDSICDCPGTSVFR